MMPNKWDTVKTVFKTNDRERSPKKGLALLFSAHATSFFANANDPKKNVSFLFADSKQMRIFASKLCEFLNQLKFKQLWKT